jgi:hypothetical protein
MFNPVRLAPLPYKVSPYIFANLTALLPISTALSDAGNKDATNVSINWAFV